MRNLLFWSALLAGIAMASVARADTVFRFDPNDLVDLYPATAGTSDTAGENKATQENARRLHETWASSWYETFYNPASPQPQSESYNTYVNWLGSLGSGEGISGFNIWLLDNPNAQSWGESTVWDPSGPAPTGSADAAGKWNVSTIANPWGPGWLVEWWTDDPTYYLRPGGADIGDFSFRGTAYHDTNSNGFDALDPVVVDGDSVRIWFGAANYTDTTGDQQWSLHFDDQGWGSISPADTPFSAGRVGSAGYGSGYEGVLSLQASAVPLPGAASLGFLLLGALGASRLIRRRR